MLTDAMMTSVATAMTPMSHRVKAVRSRAALASRSAMRASCADICFVRGYLLGEMGDVGAVTKSGSVAAYSSSGPVLDLTAPGSGIRSSIAAAGDGRYGRMSGTSMAAPHVAAAMALLKQAAPNRSVDDLPWMLKSTGPGPGRRIRDSRNGVNARLIDIGDAFRDFGLAEASAGPDSATPPELQWDEEPGTDGGNTGWTTVTK